MSKLGIASVAAVLLSGSAFAGPQGAAGNFLDGGVGRPMGIFTGAQVAAMRGISEDLYATNWNTDTNGAIYTPGNIAAAPDTAGQGNWEYVPAGVTGSMPDNYAILATRPAGSSSPQRPGVRDERRRQRQLPARHVSGSIFPVGRSHRRE
jgi:hypothetical protein